MKHIPNLFTLANATCGVIAIYFITSHSMTGVAICLIAAALFDLLDGFLARKLGVQGPLGKELDSLADAISFGAAPAFLWASILGDYGQIPQPFAIILGAFIAASSVYRLAKFNLDTTQNTDFIGMPTPANALFALGLWSWLGNWDQWEVLTRYNEDQQIVFTLVMLALWSVNVYWLNAGFKVISFKSGEGVYRKYTQWSVIVLFPVLAYFFRSLSLSIIVLLMPIISYITIRLEAKS